MDKRFQVFVSSTFTDLEAERQQVIQALLQLNCMPAGMELFPAADDTQWDLIKQVIDDCDYYLVIIGGRYGSIGPEGRSYTEMEYRYALEKGKPIIAFLHRDPSSIPVGKSETDPDGKEKLEAFRALTKLKHVRHWSSPAELGYEVLKGVLHLKSHSPAVGWIRADRALSEGAATEMLRLRQRIEDLERELAATRTTAPEDTDDLAQDSDTLSVHYTVRVVFAGGDSDSVNGQYETTWNDVFSILSPLMMDEASEAALRRALADHILMLVRQDPVGLGGAGASIRGTEVSDRDFQRIKVQFRALDLITQSVKSRSLKDSATYWKLTPYGETKMIRLLAMTRNTPRHEPQ